MECMVSSHCDDPPGSGADQGVSMETRPRDRSASCIRNAKRLQSTGKTGNEGVRHSGMFPSGHTGADRLASSFALRRSGFERSPVEFVPTVPTEIRPRWDCPEGTVYTGTGSKPDEHHWRDILTTGFEPRPRLPRLASSGCRVRPGGLLPDTVAQPSPILTAFPHFQRCFDCGTDSQKDPVKELRSMEAEGSGESRFKTAGPQKKPAFKLEKIRPRGIVRGRPHRGSMASVPL
jgi:hypothetical protein